ncbi:MAG: SusC/RagA family TonB-linked outer membrane protein [Fermentimonas sp.]
MKSKILFFLCKRSLFTVMWMMSLSMMAQNISIKGTVIDDKNLPVPGATVVVKGDLSHGTVTDIEGNYVINNVSPNATLIFSYIGMKNEEVNVNNRGTIDVILMEDTQLLDEVVVVGYGTQSKERVSTSITTVRGEKLENKPLSNITQALVGQASGVWLQQVNGVPGSVPNIRIRGNGSITSGNNPLYVVDGFPMTDGEFNAISLNDIESVDILKDAASAAIYGSKAGNGVVLVTTKKGKSGKTNFSFNSLTGFDELSKKIEMLNAEQYVEMAKESVINQGASTIPEWFTNTDLWENNDWQDVIFRKAMVQNYQLGASGGTDNVRFNMSLGYLDQQGILKNTYMTRYNFKADIYAKLSDLMTVGANFLGSYTENRNQSPIGTNTDTGVAGVIAVALSCPPIMPIWQDNGDYFIPFQDQKALQAFNVGLTNPLNKLDANKDYSKAYRPSVSMFIELSPLKNLKIRTSLLNSLIIGKRENYVEAFLAKGGTNRGNISTPDLTQITAYRNNSIYHNIYWSNTVSYDFSLNEHNLTTLLGYDVSVQSNFSTTVSPRTDENNPVAFSNTFIKNVEGAVLKTGSSGSNKYAFDGVFGRINYDYGRKYLLTASIRRDRSSRFGPNNRAGIFPSLSVGWNVANENFWSVSEISQLKIRASYGVTGNDQLSGNYPWLSSLGSSFYVFGENDNANQVITYFPGGFSNVSLGWEKNKQTDLGLDLGLFNNRISLMFDSYVRNSNTIFSSAVPILNGKSSTAIQNIGNIRNKGYEFMIATKNFTKPFRWDSNFNISFNKNTITELAPGQTQLSNSSAGRWPNVVRNYVGRPMGDFYMYRVEGTFNNEEDVKKYAKFGTQNIGDLRYRDNNGDGKITPDDMELMGNYQPDFYFGFENIFSYKQFDLSVLLNGTYGGEIVFAMERALTLGRERENNFISALERWKSENEPGSGYVHKAGTKNLGSNIQPSDRYLYSSSFLRISNITLGYNIPQIVLGKYGIQNFRLFLVAQNLYTFTEYPGYNPEANDHGNNAIRNGIDEGSYPLARNISLGINISF